MNPTENLHPLQKLPDYVLGLLPAEERYQVEQHTARCAECRQLIARERQVEALVRRTVQLTTQPTPARLATLRPSIPEKRHPIPDRVIPQLASAVMVTTLLILGLLIQLQGNGNYQRQNAPGFIATIGSPTVTPTSTRAPTATIAALYFTHSPAKGVTRGEFSNAGQPATDAGTFGSAASTGPMTIHNHLINHQPTPGRPGPEIYSTPAANHSP